MLRKNECQARQYSDSVHCIECHNKWDINDVKPPLCPRSNERVDWIIYIMILIAVSILLLVAGMMDYADKKIEQERYCEMVKAHRWPDYQQSYQKMCVPAAQPTPAAQDTAPLSRPRRMLTYRIHSQRAV